MKHNRRPAAWSAATALLIAVATFPCLQPSRAFSPSPGPALSPRQQRNGFRQPPVPLVSPTTDTTTMQASNSDGSSSMAAVDDKIQARKTRLVAGYISAAVCHLLTLTFTRSAQPTNWPFALYFLSGPVLYAGMAWIASTAARNDRLESVTYRRLNAYMVEVGLAHLIMAAVEPKFSSPFFNAAAALTLINGVKGYGYGIMGVDKSKATASEAIKSVNALVNSDYGTTFRAKNKTAYVYMAALLTVLVMKAFKIYELLQHFRPFSGFMIATRLSRLIRLNSMVGLMFTLKDAANRGRLQGTTFIELNALSALVFSTMAGYLFDTGSIALGSLIGLFSVFTAGVGIQSWTAKRSSSPLSADEKQDDDDDDAKKVK